MMKSKKILVEDKKRALSSTTDSKISKSASFPSNPDIFKIFTEVQWTEAFHEKYIKQLTKVYENTPFKIFVDDFSKCLQKVFINNDKNLEKNVELTLDFASKFIVSFNDPESENTCPLLLKIFKFLFDNHDCYDTAVRLHSCQFINCLLNALGPNASLDVDLCENIATAMMERLQDKNASVRTQAVFALHRLQDRSDENCKIMEVFLYHMTRDPSAEVRCAVINNIIIVQRTLATILSRINDCKDEVRRDAYLICSKVSMQKFRIKQRQMILNSGFLDSSDKVKDFVKSKLLPKWLSCYKDDYVLFLRALNVHSETGLDVAIKSLKAFFNRCEKFEIVDYLTSRMKQKTLPYDCLNPEIVLYWRIVAEYLLPPRDSDDDTDPFFEKIIPDLTFFSEYVKGFFTSYTYSGSSANCDDNSKQIEKEFILMQFMEITKCYDLADEYGRKNFSQLCIAFLKDSQVTIRSIPIIINRLSWAMPDVTERIATIVELISDLREPFFDMDMSGNTSFGDMKSIETTKTQLLERLKVLENERLEASQTEDLMISHEIEKEIASIEKKLSDLQQRSMDIPCNTSLDENIDPLVAIKVLKIINEMIDSRDVTRLTPTLRSLFDNVVLPSFKRNMQNHTVSSLSLETFGLFCLLDPILAKDRFILFCFLISNGSLTVPALKAMFDLLQKYGLNMFCLQDDDDFDVKEESDRRKSGNTSTAANKNDNQSEKNVIPFLYSLLDSESYEVRNITATGLCKLLLVGHLRSYKLVSKLICLWFRPDAAEDPPLRKMLSLFFKSFVKTRGAQYILEKAFLPTLQLFLDSPPDNPLSVIDIDNVVRLLINLTHPDLGTSLPKGYCVHNQLAVLICNELLENTRNSREKSITLVKALLLLSIDSSDIDFIKELRDKVETLTHKYKSLGEKNCHRYAFKFNVKLKTEAETKLAESEICNTLSTTAISDRKCDEVTVSMNATTVSEMDIIMEVDDIAIKKRNETVTDTFTVSDSDKEASDVDSVATVKNNFSSYHKNKNFDEPDIVIPSSGGEEEEEVEDKELQNLDDVDDDGEFEKRSLRSSSLSLGSQEEIKPKKSGSVRKNMKSGSSKLSQKKIENDCTVKRILRSGSSSSSQSPPPCASSLETFSSPMAKITSGKERYNTRSARKQKK